MKWLSPLVVAFTLLWGREAAAATPVPPLDSDEAEVVRTVVLRCVSEAKEFWRDVDANRAQTMLGPDATTHRARSVVVASTGKGLTGYGFVYDLDRATNDGALARVRKSSAYPIYREAGRRPRSLAPVADVESIVLQPFENVPRDPARALRKETTEIDLVDPEAFYQRFPDAASLIVVSRPAIDGDEAVVYVAQMVVFGIEGRVFRLRRSGLRWTVDAVAVLEDTPGC
jgi:hypothetical protein